MTRMSHEEIGTMHRIPADLGAVTAVRRALVAELRGAQLDPRVVQDAALVVHELAENAVRHGGGAGRDLTPGTPAVEVSWHVGDGVVDLRVKDLGTAGFNAPAWPTSRLDGGRGLHIVEQLCRSWDVQHGPDGTEVSARVDTRSDAAEVTA
ncbi:ATP-binding protein [Nocardioides perillae]|uniref:Anti-sigma regulatory factor (Ser/Thr protein kinase) n=1 Tax=Nocardioides perillae TaxID=1119534 RepID=A0A7Y9UUU2_9ACTN|nr:ATP-binding protein [Nocardioides perillae]NYG53730.1 anti-sigma regulatory factor (Ser/Thr protein kinase) [Nocardioides perillae]